GDGCAGIPEDVLHRARGASRQPRAPDQRPRRDQARRGVHARDAAGDRRMVSGSKVARAMDTLRTLGVSTVYEASGRQGLVDVELHQIVPGSRVCGPARTVLCAQGDNLTVHAAMAALQQGEVLVLAMPHEEPVALVGDLLAT